MSKIALEPNASGTGTFTIASPNSNTSRTLTLPDASGELLTTTGDGSQLTGINTTPTTAQVLTATAGATAGAVGTYGFLLEGGTNLALRSVGSTIAGSSLRFASIGSNNGGDSSVTPSGTWRLMGSYNTYFPSNDSPVSVWLRIS